MKDGSTIKSVAKIFDTKDTKVTRILRTSNNIEVQNKQNKINQKRKIIKCSVDSCLSRVYSSDLCKTHYNELKLFGHILSDDEKQCCICGDKGFKLHDKYYCNKHRNQIYKYGKILSRTKFDSNDFIIHDNYIEIAIYNKNKITKAKISKNQYDKVKQYKWYLKNNGYIGATDCTRNNVILLHRLIIDVPIDYEVDHINRNKLDNRDENLRIVTTSQNQVNKSMMRNNTSGVTGVTWDKSRNKWKVSLNINKKCYNIGRFDNLQDAIDARLLAERKYHKEFTPIERQNIQRK